MKVAIFSTKTYDRQYLTAANQTAGHELVFFESRLTPETCPLAQDFPAVCVFVHDQLDAHVLLTLFRQGTRLVALRCAGFNHVDLQIAHQLEIAVARVPAYSPHAVAEHTVALLLALNRKLHKAYNRIREGNFALDGLMGFELWQQTVGVVGTGKIGSLVAQIVRGFGSRVLAYDVAENPSLVAAGVAYVALDELFRRSDIVTLHCPLQPDTYHLIQDDTLAQMKRGVVVLNTSRGPLLDSEAAVRGLKSGKIGALGLDVYEEEGDLFYEDLSNRVIQDDVFSRMLTFPNVIITGHQAFFTGHAMEEIARQTLDNITEFEQDRTPPGLILPDKVRAEVARHV